MKFDMPKALFSGLALIAVAIYFGPGSQPVGAAGGIQKVQIYPADRALLTTSEVPEANSRTRTSFRKPFSSTRL